MDRVMYERAWQIAEEQFVAAWNSSETVAEAAEKLKQLAGGAVPRWAVLARAAQLRKAGAELRQLATAA